MRLLKNQAVVDAIVCFIGSIFVLQPPMWTTGVNETLDLLICQVQYIIVTYFFYCWLVRVILVDPWWGPMNDICHTVNVDGCWFYLEVVRTPQHYMFLSNIFELSALGGRVDTKT